MIKKIQNQNSTTNLKTQLLPIDLQLPAWLKLLTRYFYKCLHMLQFTLDHGERRQIQTKKLLKMAPVAGLI